MGDEFAAEGFGESGGGEALDGLLRGGEAGFDPVGEGEQVSDPADDFLLFGEWWEKEWIAPPPASRVAGLSPDRRFGILQLARERFQFDLEFLGLVRWWPGWNEWSRFEIGFPEGAVKPNANPIITSTPVRRQVENERIPEGPRKSVQINCMVRLSSF